VADKELLDDVEERSECEEDTEPDADSDGKTDSDGEPVPLIEFVSVELREADADIV